MSWDIFVQDLPAGIASADDIAEDFVPKAIGSRAKVLAVIAEVAPFADLSDPESVRIEGHEADIEVSVGPEDPVKSFAFHVRGGDASVGIVAAILRTLGCRALDPESDTGLFDEHEAEQSMHRWLEYRDQVVGK